MLMCNVAFVLQIMFASQNILCNPRTYVKKRYSLRLIHGVEVELHGDGCNTKGRNRFVASLRHEHVKT